MTDITFVTSNQTKLAHARYLCRNYQVNILHYKKFFYGKGYIEPRVDDRTILLSESFKDAVRRWKKYVTERDNRLFFIEDTSVKIDALSDDNNEVPGVNVKFWMQETNFEALDSELRKRGNNRRCSVTSHVMLFLTDDLRKKLKNSEGYILFKSTANGVVTKKEHHIKTQMLYPWLDSKTFNKWFVPEGYDLPVSMLNIKEADAGDFRKGAFEQMLDFLAKNDVIRNRRYIDSQVYLQFYDSFVVTGRTCAGKTTIGKYMVEKYGYYHIEASEFMTQRLLETQGTMSDVDKHEFASEVLKVDPLFVANRLVDFMHENDIIDKFVITGFRTQAEVEAFRKSFHGSRLNYIFISSKYEERCKRWMRRHREVDFYTEDRFKAIDGVQEGMGVGNISEMRGIYLFDNNIDGLPSFYKRFRSKFLRGIVQEPIRINKKELRICSITLEKAILITLAIEYQKDEKRLFTTTEIAHLVNKYFKTLERSKNNVSRYFNQAYYVYYEVSYENRRNRYRLSPIGYSEAIKTIKNIHHYIGKESFVNVVAHEVVPSPSLFEKIKNSTWSK